MIGSAILLEEGDVGVEGEEADEVAITSGSTRMRKMKADSKMGRRQRD